MSSAEFEFPNNSGLEPFDEAIYGPHTQAETVAADRRQTFADMQAYLAQTQSHDYEAALESTMSDAEIQATVPAVRSTLGQAWLDAHPESDVPQRWLSKAKQIIRDRRIESVLQSGYVLVTDPESFEGWLQFIADPGVDSLNSHKDVIPARPIIEHIYTLVQQESAWRPQFTQLLVDYMPRKNKADPNISACLTSAGLSFQKHVAIFLATNRQRFRFQKRLGMFDDDAPLNDYQRFLLEYANTIDYGDDVPMRKDRYLTELTQGPLDLARAKLYDNLFNMIITEPDDPDSDANKLKPAEYMQMATELTKGLLDFAFQNGLSPNAKILSQRLETSSALIKSIPFQEFIQLANVVTASINKNHFADQPEVALAPLNTQEIDELPKALDRIFYVIVEDPAFKDATLSDDKTKQQLVAMFEAVRGCATWAVEVGVIKNRKVPVITIGDIIMRYPKANAQEVSTIAAAMQSNKWGLEQAHRRYRELVPDGTKLKHTPHQPGYGILS